VDTGALRKRLRDHGAYLPAVDRPRRQA